MVCDSEAVSVSLCSCCHHCPHLRASEEDVAPTEGVSRPCPGVGVCAENPAPALTLRPPPANALLLVGLDESSPIQNQVHYAGFRQLCSHLSPGDSVGSWDREIVPWVSPTSIQN